MSGRKRRKSQSLPKNAKKRKVADPSLDEITPWETLPKELWETIFACFLKDHLASKVPFKFLREVSKTLKRRCNEYLQKLEKKITDDFLPDEIAMAGGGYLSCLKYAVENGLEMSSEAVEEAIYQGPYIHIIKYAVEEMKVPWTIDALCGIVKRNNIELLKYASKTGGRKFINFLVCEKAARAGGIQCLKYIKRLRLGAEWRDMKVFAKAAASGSLECVKYLHQIKCRWDAETCAAAAGKGHLEILKYCHENGCPWDDDTVYNAASNGHLDCINYAIEKGAPVTTEALQAAFAHFECMKVLHQHLGEWSEDIRWFYATIGGDRVECFRYAHENGAAWNEDTTGDAARHGAFECLKYAHETGAPWTEGICSKAVWENNFDCLKYCHENGAPWDKDTAWSAAQHSTIDCLKYCHENGCPWDAATLRVAAHDVKSFPCLEYAAENGCPRNDEVCKMCYDAKTRDYLHENAICTCKLKG